MPGEKEEDPIYMYICMYVGKKKEGRKKKEGKIRKEKEGRKESQYHTLPLPQFFKKLLTCINLWVPTG